MYAAVSASQAQGAAALITVQHEFTKEMGGVGGLARYTISGQTSVTNDWRAFPLSFDVVQSEIRAVGSEA